MKNLMEGTMSLKEIIEKEQKKPPLDEPKFPNGSEDRLFYDSAIAKFGSIMRWKDSETLQSWAENLLEQLVPFMGGLQGTLFAADLVRKELNFVSAFAVDFESNLKRTYKFGEGLVGQVGLNQELMVLADQNEFVSISSYQKIRLKCIIIVPLVYNYRTVGVIEVNFPQSPPEKQLHFLKLISDSIAASLNALIKEQELAQSFRKLKSSEERLQRLAEVTTEGVAFLDDSYQIVECNSAFAKIFAYPEEEIKFKSFTQFFAEPDHCKLGIKENLDVTWESVGVRKDGTTLDIEVQEREFNEHKRFSHIISVRDISKRKQTESNLRVKEQELEEAQKVVELTEIIRKKNLNITASINYAKRIQDALLPEIPAIKQSIPEFFVFFRPKDIVSGDFYWFTQEEDKLVVAAVDCTGHGVPGAIMSMAGSVFLKQIVNLQGITAPNEILAQLHLNINKSLKQQETRNRDGMDCAVCTIDQANRVVEFAGAKNSLIYVQDGNLLELAGDNTPVGGYWNKSQDTLTYNLRKIEYYPRTMFYMASDGYEDQFGGSEGKKFMKTRFRELLLDIYYKPVDEQLQILTQTMDDWMQDEKQIDDMLIVGFRL
ncbi:MAG: SpoIIE family protein phosphatase [Microscillaceae bacterium]|nr:SpoIIE family protein phosphatase [Microscillaceae bacterium]